MFSCFSHPHPLSRLLTKAVAPAALLLLGAGCQPDGNFSQYPGFERYRAEAARATLPDAKTRALLQKHKPRLFLAADQPGPIDFYRDYIAAGDLYDGDGELISRAVTPEILNRHRNDPSVVFRHRPRRQTPMQVACADGAINAAAGNSFFVKVALNNRDEKNPPCRATAFASATSGEMTLGGQTRKVIFLNYHFVFRHSGLPAGVAKWQRFFADFFTADGGVDDWHQLDHYTAATIALDDETGLPFAVMLQQHNYLRTFFVGADPAFPRGAKMKIDVARGSNELYPHREGRAEWPAASSLTKRSVGYLAGIEAAPMLAARDITEGDTEAHYDLAFLSPADAFYVFQGYLGEPRLLPGREGPPGAMYNMLPTLKPPEIALPVFYWTTPDAEYARIVRDLYAAEDLSAPCFDSCIAAKLNTPAFAALYQRFAAAYDRYYGAQQAAVTSEE